MESHGRSIGDDGPTNRRDDAILEEQSSGGGC